MKRILTYHLLADGEMLHFLVGAFICKWKFCNANSPNGWDGFSLFSFSEGKILYLRNVKLSVARGSCWLVALSRGGMCNPPITSSPHKEYYCINCLKRFLNNFLFFYSFYLTGNLTRLQGTIDGKTLMTLKTTHSSHNLDFFI